MCNVILNNGVVVSAYLVTKHQQPQPQIHIFPKALTISEIYQYFDNAEATESITVETEKVDHETGETTVIVNTFNGFTELFSVQRSMYHPDLKEYMVWLQKPTETI